MNFLRKEDRSDLNKGIGLTFDVGCNTMGGNGDFV
jgi:hypothetical protein